MEVEFVRGVSMNPDNARSAGKVAADKGIRLSAHAPYFVNLNARDLQKIAASRERILRTSRITSILGGDSVVVHTAFYMGDPPHEAYATVKQNLKLIVSKLRSEGNHMWIRPEVMGKNASFGTLDEVLNLSAEVAGVAPAVDFAHLHARTGEFNSYGDFIALLEHIEKRLGRAALENMLIHISGIEYGPKGERKHLVLAESDLKYVELLKALKDCKVAGSVICESPNREEDALLLQQTYRAL
jgi:deoxyribonuclease-4